MTATDWIQTATGRRFYPLSPRAEDVDIRDIAHALSLLCRFNGHSAGFYSVAEHSVRVCDSLPAEHKLWGLLHDAAEAYLGDLPRPLKRQLPAFSQAEDVVLRCVMDRYGLAWPMPPAVRAADDQLLATEARDLMGAPAWARGTEPLPAPIEPWTPTHARDLFLERFHTLVGQVPGDGER